MFVDKKDTGFLTSVHVAVIKFENYFLKHLEGE